MDVFNKTLLLTLSITTLLFSVNAYAENDYMLMLEAEADGTRLDQGANREIDAKQLAQQGAIVDKKWQGNCAYDKDCITVVSATR